MVRLPFYVILISMKTKIFFTAILVFLIILSYKTIAQPTKLSPGDSWVDLASTGIIDFENKIDRNLTSWKEYKDSTIAIKMPIYLPYFNNISATELTQKDELVSNYFRLSGSAGESGRSYWITLLEPQFKTNTKDVKEWITSNKKNLDIGMKEEVDITPVSLGGLPAYQVKFGSNQEGVPVLEKIYFQTRDGIRSIGFRAWDDDIQRKADYLIYQKIISTLRFTSQFE